MKKKTFFATLLLFTLFFNASILLVTVITLKDRYSAVRSQCLAEHYIIANSLLNDINALDDRNKDPLSSMEALMQPYTRYSQNKLMKLAVSYKEQWIFQSDETDVLPVLQLPKYTSTTARQVCVSGNGFPVLNIYGCFPSPCQDYGLLYRYDLTDMLVSWRHLKKLLFLSGLGVTFLLACCLKYLLDVVFRPLYQISAASRNIADGNYQMRIPDSGKDEISAMARNFNVMARTIEEQIAQLKQSSLQKQQFIDNFAHELRTPMTAVYGYAEYIQKAAISEEDKYSATDFIMSECRRLQNMAGQLLALATLRADDIPMEPVSVKDLLEKVCSTMMPKTADFQVILLAPATRPQEHDRYITGNPDLLESLLCNLIDNALKACRAHGRILLDTADEEGMTVIFVEDDGIGIPPEQLSHITEAFYRADKSRSRKQGGAGLGLSLCESIAALHHARLDFQSSPGKGTKVKIYFLQVDNNCETE